MINRLFKTNFEQYNLDINLEQIDKINNEIKKVNYKHLLMLSTATIIFELLLIVFHDIPEISKDNTNIFIAKMYLIFHSLILITSSIVLVFLKIYNKKPNSKIHGLIVEAAVLIIMLCMACIGVLDQITIGQITSYITALMVCGIPVLIKPPKSYLVFSIPHAIFIYLSFLFQQNQAVFTDIAINSTIFCICVLLISKVIYKNQTSHLMKNIVLETANKKLEYLSNYDCLTNLFNRRYFESFIKRNIIENKYYAKEDLIIAIMDIDNFKYINDKYGHKAGDIMLQEIAAIIIQNIRNVDLAARWGGEEFVILFSNISIKNCESITNRIRKKIEENEVKFDNNLIHVTASFGLSKLKKNTDVDFKNCFMEADKALYMAKTNGKNRVEYQLQ